MMDLTFSLALRIMAFESDLDLRILIINKPPMKEKKIINVK